jgi:hypothetical protein
MEFEGYHACACSRAPVAWSAGHAAPLACVHVLTSQPSKMSCEPGDCCQRVRQSFARVSSQQWLPMQVTELDAIVVPVSGGGMLGGVATVVKALRPSIVVVAAEPTGEPANGWLG